MDLSSFKVLVVGAGGIGCELLYSLAKTGFVNIEAVDKDTIELSNLNRQFLFRTTDISKAKVETAKKTLMDWFPSLNMVAHHSDITASSFSVNFYKKFDIVINALDNQEARRHVNRMCFFAKVPLVDGGTGGYLGQATPIIWGNTECYDCVSHAIPDTYPVCTIRNNPSKLVHCIVWAKNVFNELFGIPDEINHTGINTLGDWFNKSDGHVSSLLTKVFVEDIELLQKLTQMWEKKKPPITLSAEWIDSAIEDEVNEQLISTLSLNTTVFKPETWVSIFKITFKMLVEKNAISSLIFDKDDDVSMAFIAAASNIRAFLFGIENASCFKIKDIAGNIVPAIATTNDIVASLCVIEAVKILNGKNDPKEVYLTRKPLSKKIISPMKRPKPNPNCCVCSPTPIVHLACKTDVLLVGQFKTEVMEKRFGISGADVSVDGPSASIIISFDESETIDNLGRTLSYFGIGIGSILNVFEFSTSRNIKFIFDTDSCPDEKLFLVIDSESSDSTLAQKEDIDEPIEPPIAPKKRKMPALENHSE
ncbi:SUMO-activating enzyme subunit 2 [Thelohanellus kitauei]|uniref:SUMO-activating enzyme subunit n=1 Tax=Thelohanellus kitauei TaxID=669202 RepID=A0A0C2MNM9_THEKT|nr:SUMO-activating enzyme subunit 2 [Thelohanellus kitauei]